MIWPVTVFAISVVFLFIFKRPLSDLLDRTKGISRDGLQTSDGKANERIAQTEKAEADAAVGIQNANEDKIAEVSAKLEQAIHDLGLKQEQAEQNAEEIKAELLRFQKNIGYKHGELR